MLAPSVVSGVTPDASHVAVLVPGIWGAFDLADPITRLISLDVIAQFQEGTTPAYPTLELPDGTPDVGSVPAPFAEKADIWSYGGTDSIFGTLTVGGVPIFNFGNLDQVTSFVGGDLAISYTAVFLVRMISSREAVSHLVSCLLRSNEVLHARVCK